MNFLHVLFFVLLVKNYSYNKVQGLRAEKIIDGVIPEEFVVKHVVALMYDPQIPDAPHEFQCAGAIIGDFHIATIAHCFFDKETGLLISKEFYVRVSVMDVYNPGPTSLRHNVDLVYFPRNYVPSTPDTYSKSGNIAVIQLRTSLGLRTGHRNLRKVVLSRHVSKADHEVFIVAGYGWHQTWLNESQYDNGNEKYLGTSDGKVRVAVTDVFDHETCQNQMIRDWFAPDNICGKIIQRSTERKGICKGDSGGPVVRGEHLVGLAIHGFRGCNENQYPGVYASIPVHYQFIDNVLKGIRTVSMRVFQLKPKTGTQFVFEEV